jgi:ATP-binding cassette, subfamily C (CFTR/MRP), member 1
MSTDTKSLECKDDVATIAEKQQHKKRWIHRLNPFVGGESPAVPYSDAGLVPEMNANWFSKLTWGWMTPLMMVNPELMSLNCKKGYKRPLQKEDLWHYDEHRLTRSLADKLAANLNKRRDVGITKYTLLAALNETFFWPFWIAGFLRVLTHTDC